MNGHERSRCTQLQRVLVPSSRVDWRLHIRAAQWTVTGSTGAFMFLSVQNHVLVPCNFVTRPFGLLFPPLTVSRSPSSTP